MDPNEPNWRTNSSFSAPFSTRWDLILQQDGSPHESHGVPICVSSLSSQSKGSGSHMNSERYFNHQPSVSDGALSYSGSPSNFKIPRCTPAQKFDLGEFTASNRGARPEFSTVCHPSERSFIAGASLSNSIGSGSPLSESGRWGSNSKGPPRHSISRRSFMSKPVYPLLSNNPVLGNETSGSAETSGGDRLTPVEDKASTIWPESDSGPELKFHKSLSVLQKLEASPSLDTSSRRQGFRWSNASSYDLGLDEAIDIPESIMLENLRPLTPVDQRCGLCRRLLSQKSPWSSSRVVRNGDMPIAGVLACGHVFHADCLEEMTPKTQIHEPPCPVCSGVVDINDTISFSEPLQLSLHKKAGAVVISENAPMGSNLEGEADLKRNHSLPLLRRGSSSLIKKRFSFKGGMGKDLLGSKMLGRRASTSSSSTLYASKSHIGCIKNKRLPT